MNRQGRIAFYSHDTMGLGHLRRCLKMAAAITEQLGTQNGLILTGSPWSHFLSPPEGFRFVSLPPVIKTGVSEYQPRDPALSLDAVIAERRAVIDEKLLRFAPRLLVVDNVPCGLRGEILQTLVALRELGTRIVLSLRDVLDEDAAIRREWQASGAVEALVDLYDEIWLFGTRASPTHRMIPQQLHARTVICGHLGAGDVDQATRASDADPRAADSATRAPHILVTGGGGGDSAALVETYIAAMRVFRPAVRTRIVLGPEFPADQIPGGSDLDALGITMVSFDADMERAIGEADVVVSMAGYNTVCEALAAGRRMVLVPRVWPRREQWIRATELGASGRAEVIHPSALTPDSLWSAVERALSQPESSPQLQDGRLRVAQRTAALLPPSRMAATGAA